MSSFISSCHFQCLNKGIVNVLLLNGRKYRVICNPVATTTRMLFERIIKSEQICENYILGLCALVGGDFVFLSADLKIYKVAPQIWIQSATRKTNEPVPSTLFTLYLRVKFFLPTLRIISMESRHILYLQLRKTVLENQIVCTDDDLITLGGLALQAEIGDFKEEVSTRVVIDSIAAAYHRFHFADEIRGIFHNFALPARRSLSAEQGARQVLAQLTLQQARPSSEGSGTEFHSISPRDA